MSRIALNFCKNSTVLRKSLNSNKFQVKCMSNWIPIEKPTHTGQKWECDDYRLARFIDKPKQINPNWAIDLIDEIPPKGCKERVVWCDGGSGPTGHPKIYINLDKPGCHSCGYCGLRFYLDAGHH